MDIACNQIIEIYDDCRYKIVFLTRKVDLEIAKIADFKVCLENSSNEIKNACDYVIKSDQFNDVLKFFNKLFYAKNIDKKLLKYKNKK